MSGIVNSFVDSTVQCWGCPIFDRLFQVISSAASAVYRQFSLFAILIFCILLSFYILYSVWKNINTNLGDYTYQKSIKPILINSLLIFSLLGLGVYLPRTITTMTFEPVADMTLVYTQSMLKTDTETVEKKVIYENKPMADDGFYRPQLRDKIVLLMKTTITQFQSYMKLGFAVMDNAFSWTALFGMGALMKHILMFFIGLYLVYGFFKIFIRFCFYFIDVIVAMTFFAFFFPLSLVVFVFKNQSDAPEWMKKLGSDFGATQFKQVINAIITLAAAVLTYTIVMVIIAKFFAESGTNSAELTNMIIGGNLLSGSLSDDNLATMTLMGCIVLVYLINFLIAQVPKVTEMVLDAFDVKAGAPIGEDMANNAMRLTELAVNKVKDVGNIIIGNKKEETQKPAEKK